MLPIPLTELAMAAAATRLTGWIGVVLTQSREPDSVFKTETMRPPGHVHSDHRQQAVTRLVS